MGPLHGLTIAKTQRDYGMVAAIGDRLVRLPRQILPNVGKPCISIIKENSIIPTIFDVKPSRSDMRWYLGAFEPESISGRLISVPPAALEELFNNERKVGSAVS